MGAPLISSPEIPRLADLLERLGGIPPERVRYWPLPGTATVDDVVEIERRESRLCELVDGVLVEKPMGYRESMVAVAIASALQVYVAARKLGVVTGEGGMMRLSKGLVRIPDVAFVSRERLPGARVPSRPVPALAPDLAIEVLSASNTKAEMDRKCREYFEAGARLVWLVDLDARSVKAFESIDRVVTIGAEGTLSGGAVLPGFELAVAEVFAQLEG